MQKATDAQIAIYANNKVEIYNNVRLWVQHIHSRQF